MSSMSLDAVVNFISLIGFPAFMAYYIFTKYTEERKCNTETKLLLSKLELMLDKLSLYSQQQKEVLSCLIEKMDKLIEINVKLFERIAARKEW